MAQLPQLRANWHNDELDAPGEYYIDRQRGILYFYNPSVISANTDAVLSLLPDDLFSIRSAVNVTISGLTMEAGQRSAVNMIYGSGNTIKNCTCRNLGENGIIISAGNNHTVMESEVYGTGKTGIYLGGGNRTTLTPCNHLAFANDVHDFARFTYCYRPGISVNLVGIKVVNNRIHSAPHSAITFGQGNNHEVYFNEIYNVCKETSDSGALYQGRDWTSQGTYVSYNYFHDIRGATEDVSAIYFDDQNSGTTAYGNIIANVPKGVLIGGGRDNHVENNIFLNVTDTTLHADAHGLEPDRGGVGNVTVFQRLFEMPYKIPPWSVQYPTLAKILDDPISPHAPRYNSYRHNVACRCLNLQRTTPRATDWIRNVTSHNWWSNATSCQNAIFPNIRSGSLMIPTNAPYAKNITFSAIPWQRIGRAGAYTSLPPTLPGLKYGSIVTPKQDMESKD